MPNRQIHLVRDLLLPLWRKCNVFLSDLIKGFGFFHTLCLSFLAEFFFLLIVWVLKWITFLVAIKVRNTLPAKH